MKIGIDASNIRSGGGKHHLLSFIKASLEVNKDVSFVLVSNKQINDQFLYNDRVYTITNTLLNSFNFCAFFSQVLFSNKYFKTNHCDLVFAPGGIFLSRFRPFYTMSQNMLPFDIKELEGFSYFKKLKFKLIKRLQLFTFRKSNGVIFLTHYAKEIIQSSLGANKNCKVIPHGIIQQSNNNYSYSNKVFKILYVSDFLPYKHHFNVVKAVSEMILEGYNIELTLIGKKDKKEYNKIKNLINPNVTLSKNIKILGAVDYTEVIRYYQKSTLFLFASTCENLPFIVLEAMSFGLPIISSNKRPMSNIVNGKNVLFNSHKVETIKKTILNNMSRNKLLDISKKNFESSKEYIWRDNVSEALSFFSSMK